MIVKTLTEEMKQCSSSEVVQMVLKQLTFGSDLTAAGSDFSPAPSTKVTLNQPSDGPWMSSSTLWDCSMDPYRGNEAAQQQ